MARRSRPDNTELRQRAEALTAPTSWQPPPADPDRCAECDGTGWVRVDDSVGVSAVVRCAVCQSKLRGQAPGVPVEEHGAFLELFKETADNRDAIAQGRLFLDGTHPDLYLQGGVGTGKTKLACCLLNHLWRAGKRVEFIRVPLLLTTLLPGADDMDQTIDRVVSVPFIVLDDVGASQATDFARRMLLVIYEGRGDRGHRTIWTSNLDLPELGEFLTDDRLVSRIAGRAKVATLKGKDWRIRKSMARS